MLIDIVIAWLVRDLSSMHRDALSKEQYDGLMSQLWQNPGFRKYIADRDAKLIYTLAGGEGMEPEPRDKYLLHAGQRFENLLLAREAKQAWTRSEKIRAQSLALEQDGVSVVS